jgi:hypothetical protein
LFITRPSFTRRRSRRATRSSDLSIFPGLARA